MVFEGGVSRWVGRSTGEAEGGRARARDVSRSKGVQHICGHRQGRQDRSVATSREDRAKSTHDDQKQ